MKSILIFTICIIIAIAAQYHGENNFNNKYYTQEIINLRFQKQSLMNRL